MESFLKNMNAIDLCATGRSKMRALRIVAAVALLASLLLPLSAGSAYGADDEPEKRAEVKYPNPHDKSNKQTCKVCHEPETMKLRQDPLSTCLRCHEGNRDGHPVARHPVGQQTKIKFPKALPSAPGNKLVCYTCHEPHNSSGNPRLLRINFDALCASCHVGY